MIELLIRNRKLHMVVFLIQDDRLLTLRYAVILR